MEYNDTIKEKIEICKKYIAKRSLLGCSDLVFGINIDKNSKYFGKISILSSVDKKYTTLIIPDFVDHIGIENYMTELNDKNYLIIYNETLKFDDLIGNKIFNCSFMYSNIDTLVLGKEVCAINDSAFACSSIRNVIINDSNKLKCIGKRAFSECDNLESINLCKIGEEGVIREEAFSSCDRLLKVDLTKVGKIESKAFFICKNLQEVKMPVSKEFRIIEKETFTGCSKLEYIDINNNVEIIEKRAFFNCPLDTIRIGRKVKTIDNMAFKISMYAAREGIYITNRKIYFECDSLYDINTEYRKSFSRLVDSKVYIKDNLIERKEILEFINREVEKANNEHYR